MSKLIYEIKECMRIFILIALTLIVAEVTSWINLTSQARFVELFFGFFFSFGVSLSLRLVDDILITEKLFLKILLVVPFGLVGLFTLVISTYFLLLFTGTIFLTIFLALFTLIIFIGIITIKLYLSINKLLKTEAPDDKNDELQSSFFT